MQPRAVFCGFKPRNSYDRLLRMGEIWVVEEWRRKLALMAQKCGVFGVGNLVGGKFECIHPDAVDRTLVVLAGVRSHEEQSCGDGNHLRIRLCKRGFGESGHRGLVRLA